MPMDDTRRLLARLMTALAATGALSPMTLAGCSSATGPTDLGPPVDATPPRDDPAPTADATAPPDVPASYPPVCTGGRQ